MLKYQIFYLTLSGLARLGYPRASGETLDQKMAQNKMFVEFNFGRGLFYGKIRKFVFDPLWTGQLGTKRS